MNKNIFAEQNILIADYGEEKSNNMHKYHFHKYYEMYYLLSGKRILFINNRSIVILPSQLVIIAPGVLHKFMNSDSNPNYSRIIMYFNCGAFLPDMLKNQQLLSILDSNFYIADIPAKVFTEITELLRCEINSDKPLRSLSINGCFLRAMAEAARSQHRDIPQKENDLIASVKAYIDENISGDLSLDMLASKFFVNPSYLSRCFKKKTNIHLSQYIAEKRIQYSLHILVTQCDKPICEVARMSGFSGITTFNRTFKSIMHCTPGSFKKNACEFKI